MVQLLAVMPVFAADAPPLDRVNINRFRTNSWQVPASGVWRDYVLRDDDPSTYFSSHTGAEPGGAGAIAPDYVLVDLDFGSNQRIARIELDSNSTAGRGLMVDIRPYRHPGTAAAFPGGQTLQAQFGSATELTGEDIAARGDFAMAGWVPVIPPAPEPLGPGEPPPPAPPSPVTIEGLGGPMVVLTFDPPVAARYLRFAIYSERANGTADYLQLAGIRAFSDRQLPQATANLQAAIFHADGQISMREARYGYGLVQGNWPEDARDELQEVLVEARAAVTADIAALTAYNNAVAARDRAIEGGAANIPDPPVMAELRAPAVLAETNAAIAAFGAQVPIDVDVTALYELVNTGPLMLAYEYGFSALYTLWENTRTSALTLVEHPERTQEMIDNHIEQIEERFTDIAAYLDQYIASRQTAINRGFADDERFAAIEADAAGYTSAARIRVLDARMRLIDAPPPAEGTITIPGGTDIPPFISSNTDGANAGLIIAIAAGVLLIIGAVVLFIKSK